MLWRYATIAVVNVRLAACPQSADAPPARLLPLQKVWGPVGVAYNQCGDHTQSGHRSLLKHGPGLGGHRGQEAEAARAEAAGTLASVAARPQRPGGAQPD